MSDWSSDVCSSDLVTRAVDGTAHIGFQFAPDAIALGVPEHAAMRFGLQMEQVHVLPQPAMVAFCRLLQPDEMVGELLPVQPAGAIDAAELRIRSEEHTSELQSLMRISYAVFCLKKTKTHQNHTSA